jgi:predicted dehydrogenase
MGLAWMKQSANVGIVGTGFVADLYMRSLKTFPDIRVVKAFDIDRRRLSEFCSYWNLSPAQSLEELLHGEASPDLVLNLTNPHSHFEVSQACLAAGKHVYSEKPLATEMNDAIALCELAEANSVMLTSAPCSVLGEAAQTVWQAVRSGAVGQVRLVYAELDDDFVSKAPYLNWRSESGAPWPYRDEFLTGCTLEHAGYYLTWLIAMFGSVKTVVAASANLVNQKLEDGTRTAPDFSTATLYFQSGTVARLTCSIVAPHDHSLRIIGDTGVLEVGQSWDNEAAVRIRRRVKIRRRLFNTPYARRYRIKGPTHPKVGRWGAASMNFALGPAEMLSSIRESRLCRLTTAHALHLNEVTLAIQHGGGIQEMKTSCPAMEPMPWALSALGAPPAGGVAR